MQGFSLSGNRDAKDPRNSLFMDFMRFLRAINPRFFVMENVTGILTMKTKDGQAVRDIIQREAHRSGFKSRVVVLNAADYGVPQTRERAFFIGVRRSMPANATCFRPPATHTPRDYVTVDEAISDLPDIGAGEGSEVMQYASPPANSYQRSMRARSDAVRNHVAMRHTSRLVERFKMIGHGQSVTHVASTEHGQRRRGRPDEMSGKAFGQNNMRVFPDRPSPTVAASFQSNFIHPHKNRNFTAREGARLQSFPDHFVFCGRRTTMSWEKNLSQYQQIGNAVPPLLAKAICLQLMRYFSSIRTVVDDGLGAGVPPSLF